MVMVPSKSAHFEELNANNPDFNKLMAFNGQTNDSDDEEEEENEVIDDDESRRK